MISQGDQLLNQLKQYDIRKNQLKSTQSISNLSKLNSNSTTSLSNNYNNNYNNNNIEDVIRSRDGDGDGIQFSLGDDNDNDNEHDNENDNGNDNDNENDNNNEIYEEYKLIGNNSLIPGYEQFNNTQELIQHTYTSLKILDIRPRFVPPINFSCIENDIYRSGHPQPNNFEFLTTLKLKTIIYLGDKTDNYEYYKWIKEQNDPIISFRFFKMLPPSSFSDGTAFNDKVALNTILNLVLNKSNYPILIHSNKGKHRVGVLVGLIRRFLQGWSLSGTFDEYGKFAREKGEGDLEFIEMFKPILKIDLNTLPSFVRIDK